MVFHVTTALHAFGIEVALKLGEYVAVGLSNNVGEDVQTPSVGHAQNRFFDAQVGREVQDALQHDDRRLSPFESEALLTNVTRMQEALKDFGFTQHVKNATLLIGAGRHALALDTLLNPALLGRVQDVAVLDANRATVGVAQNAQYLFQRRVVAPGESVHQERSLQVPDGEPVVREVELFVQRGCLTAQGIKIRVQVSTYAIHIDERLHSQLLNDSFAVAIVGARIDVLSPACRLVGNAQRRKDVVVKFVRASQTLRDVF